MFVARSWILFPSSVNCNLGHSRVLRCSFLSPVAFHPLLPFAWQNPTDFLARFAVAGTVFLSDQQFLCLSQ